MRRFVPLAVMLLVLTVYVSHGSKFPIGRSLDEHGRIQIDSDASGSGGVQPELRVPRTLKNISAYAGGTDVELMYAREWLASH